MSASCYKNDIFLLGLVLEVSSVNASDSGVSNVGGEFDGGQMVS